VLVRIVVEHRRGTATLFPGALLDLPTDEAMVLVQDGEAVPETTDEPARECR
jgi:hypothetical protein